MEIHVDLISMKVCHFQLPDLMGILAVHYNKVSKQHSRLHISETLCTFFLFSFQFWSLLKFDIMQNKVK